MKNNIVIECSNELYRVAVLEGNRLAEFITEKKAEASIVGNIYKAEVKNVLPSQFAFLDIGRDKNAFLYLSDPKEKNRTVKRGNELLVQVSKDPTGDKGACLTTQLSLTGRLCVIIKSGNACFSAVSKKITDEGKRAFLQRAADYAYGKGYSAIMRTNALDSPMEAILAEIDELIAILEGIAEKEAYVRPPACMYGVKTLNGLIRDLMNAETESVTIDDEAEFSELTRYASGFFEGAGELIKLYNDEKPLFECYNIEPQLEKALQKKAWLKSGAYIVIEKTEALSVIDVNSGKFAGSGNSEDSIYAVNMEAAAEMARQIRLRNLSGIILADFIDMNSEARRQELTDYLRRETLKDRMAVNIVGITQLGLVEMTRKKGREPIDSVMFTDCKHCNGSGKQKK